MPPSSGKSSKQDAARRLAAAVVSVENAYHRLVLLVGRMGAGKTELLQQLAAKLDCPVLNVNLELSRRMLELPRRSRARQVDRIFKEALDALGRDTVVLDNLEILFDAGLQLDPLRLLKAASRNRTVVVSWNGTISEDSLTYAEPHHPEYRQYRGLDIQTIAVGPQAAAQEQGSRG